MFINFFSNKNFWSNKNIIIFIVIIIILIIIYTYGTKFEKIITVKEINNLYIYKSSGNFISDTNNNIYKISNSIFYLFFTSTELYDEIDSNKTYKIKGYGLRIPILGLYPQITSVELIK